MYHKRQISVRLMMKYIYYTGFFWIEGYHHFLNFVIFTFTYMCTHYLGHCLPLALLPGRICSTLMPLSHRSKGKAKNRERCWGLRIGKKVWQIWGWRWLESNGWGWMSTSIIIVPSDYWSTWLRIGNDTRKIFFSSQFQLQSIKRVNC
jgi:hypothetical protein